jgi:pyruvate dehydrogenase E2 component (dihydrolipoamide acetyltransferase)
MATPILMPKQGNSVESCLIVAWKKQKGDTVKEGDVICEVETDKAVMDVESTVSGVLLETFFPEGADVPVQTVIAVVGKPGEEVTSFAPSVSVGEKILENGRGAGGSVRSADWSRGEKENLPVISIASPFAVSPRAKKLAIEKDVAVAELQGTGPGGRIIERDILTVLTAIPLSPLLPFPPSPSDSSTSITNPVERIPIQGLRKRIAERMLQSLQTSAQLTLNAWADARELLETRAIIKKNAEKFSFPNITVNDLVLFAVSRTLLQHPELNATFENDTIYHYKNVHLGFAVDTARGLLVPVIKNAHQLRLPELAMAAKQLASDARESRITPDSLQGGTFTISNLGSFGIEHFTPVLNPPQVAILGVGTITPKAVLHGDETQTYPHIALSVTVNHQVVDGAPAARFLQTLSQNIATISSLLII